MVAYLAFHDIDSNQVGFAGADGSLNQLRPDCVLMPHVLWSRHVTKNAVIWHAFLADSSEIAIETFPATYDAILRHRSAGQDVAKREGTLSSLLDYVVRVAPAERAHASLTVH
jgi:hypothetical protein